MSTDVEKLMKRCQIGVGGRNALDDAHSIMAECYGTLGRLNSDLTAARARVAELEAGLRTLIRAYVNTLENGRDRIVMLGGQCDPVDQMEREDPHLRAARALLFPSPQCNCAPFDNEGGAHYASCPASSAPEPRT